MKKIVVLALFSTSLFAANFTITGAESETQVLSDSNDIGIITDTGSITITGEGNGVTMNSEAGSVTGQQVTNAGAIRIEGTLYNGIYNATGGAEATITNSGTILATNTQGWGITNSGSSSCIITNSGAITTQGAEGLALVNGASSPFTTITNSGTVRATGTNGLGIYNNASNSCTLTNSGTITTTGANGFGIYNFSSNSCAITNSGVITTTGTSAYAIYSTGADTVLTNSGTIKSEQSYAIYFTGANPTLILNRGSNIQGVVNSDNALNLTVQNGLNLRLTIEEQNGFGAINISMPYVKIGNTETIATVDPRSFGMQSDMLEDLSDVILDDIYRNADNYINCSFPGQGIWVAGIGTTRTRGGALDTRYWQGGFLLGYDGNIGKENALGGFVGGSWGKGEVESDTTTVATAPTESYFGGLTFEQQYKWAFFSAALSAGYFQSNNKRTVFYNLAPNGQQIAKAKSGGGMLTAEMHGEMWLFQPDTLRPLITATLRYAGLYLGNYSEEGSSSNLSVKNRNISLIKPKLLLNMAISNRYNCLNTEKSPSSPKFEKLEYTLQPYVGVAGRFQVGGNTVDSQLLGVSLDFNSTAPKNIAELLVGIYGNVNIVKSWSLFFNAEGLWDTKQSSRFLGEGGFTSSF